MRFVFVVLLFIHGLISLMGFLKSFNVIEINQFEADVSRTAGIFWLLSSILLFLLVLQTILKSEYFWLLGSIALVLSQVMIIWFWKDAKYGTIINLVLLVLVMINFSMWNHNRTGKQLGSSLLENCKPLPMEENSDLPDLVKKWLENSRALNSAPPNSVRFSQNGTLRLEPDKPWLAFDANQYVSLNDPSFIWTSRVGQGEVMQFSGIDQFINGKGTMNISLYGLIDVVDAKGKEINQGAAVRYLAEIVWYPWLARSKYITWKEYHDYQLKASFQYEGLFVEGLFTFDKNGFPIQFKAIRYNDQKKKNIPWRVDIDLSSYSELEGVSIPTRASVVWEYETIDFHWLDVEIISYDY